MKKNYWKFALIIAFILVGLFLLRYCTGITDGGIAGFDRNRDGVRDDIEAFIDKEYGQDKRLRSVVRQLTKSIQNNIEHPDTSDETVGDKAMKCLNYVVGRGTGKSYSILLSIESAAANTYPRIRAYIKYNARFGGTITTTYRGDVKSACDFDPSIVQ